MAIWKCKVCGNEVEVYGEFAPVCGYTCKCCEEKEALSPYDKYSYFFDNVWDIVQKDRRFSMEPRLGVIEFSPEDKHEKYYILATAFWEETDGIPVDMWIYGELMDEQHTEIPFPLSGVPECDAAAYIKLMDEWWNKTKGDLV